MQNELEKTGLGISQQQETTINTATGISTAERLARVLGRGWRAYARRTAGVELVGIQGVPASGATALLCVVKLSAVRLLLYVAFWIALVLLCVAAAAWAAAANTSDEEKWSFTDLTELR